MTGAAGREARFVAFVYMAVAAIWFVVSDGVVALLTDDIAAVSRLQTVKGWLFVGLTGALLYALVRHSIAIGLGERSGRLISERRYHALVESLPHGVAEVAPDCTIVYANPALERMFGYPAAELVGVRLGAVLADPEEGATAEARCRNLLQGAPPGSALSARGRRKDGTAVELEMAWVLRRREEGRGVTLVVTDVSERCMTETLARRQREEAEAALALLETVYATAPVGLCFVDGELRFVRINERLAEINGRSVADHIGRTVDEILPDMAPKLVPLYREVFATGRPIPDQEMKGVMPGTKGERYWLMSYFPVRQNGAGTIGVNSVVLDITDRKLYERKLRDAAAELARNSSHLARANAELEQFSYVVAHDLKAPLRAVANLAEWLREELGTALSPSAQEYVELMRNRVMRMDSLIDALLQYARVDVPDGRPEPVDAGALVGDLIAAQPLPPGFHLLVDPDMPTFCACRRHLGQALGHLIANAVEHHDRPDGRVTVHARRRDGQVEFTVEDDGPGIAPEYHAKVFQMFQTLAVPDDPRHVGIGLPLVRKLVENHGGKVMLDSASGRGTRVRFTWPEAQC